MYFQHRVHEHTHTVFQVKYFPIPYQQQHSIDRLEVLHNKQGKVNSETNEIKKITQSVP